MNGEKCKHEYCVLLYASKWRLCGCQELLLSLLFLISVEFTKFRMFELNRVQRSSMPQILVSFQVFYTHRARLQHHACNSLETAALTTATPMANNNVIARYVQTLH